MCFIRVWREAGDRAGGRDHPVPGEELQLHPQQRGHRRSLRQDPGGQEIFLPEGEIFLRGQIFTGDL